MSTVTLQQTAVVRGDAVHRELDGEVIALNLETGTYFGLDLVATRVWQLLQEPARLSAVCDTMEGEFEVERATLERDVLALVDRLKEKGLVQIVP